MPASNQRLAQFASALLLAAAQSLVAGPATSTAGIDPVVQALCGKHVALLGEPAMHGFGNTLQFKTQLVRRLVDECHYNALFVESGLYDYIHIARELRSGRDVPDAMISAAIGGLWANNEVKELVPFLREKVKDGALTLGGLDDQLGAGTYASREMSADLVESLQNEKKADCLAVLQRHVAWQYTSDSPYSPADKEKIIGCLNEIQARLLSEKKKTILIDETRVMVDSIHRCLGRDFTENDFSNKEQRLKWDNDRDQSMYLNYQWLASRLPPGSRIIVWAATVHVAKDLNGIEGFEGRIPFGAYIHNDLKDEAVAIGFSASSGEYAPSRQPARRLTDAPPSSLEGRIFSGTNSSAEYLSRERLQNYNAIAARPLGTDFKTAHWDRVLDGLVVFRVERAPAWLKPPNR